MLKCKNPDTNYQDIINEFKDSDEGLEHDANFSAVFEHDQWFVTCLGCGMQWSVNDAECIENEYFQFDEITHGDDSCFIC